MTTVDPRELAAHLRPEITEGRLARQWASVDSKLPRPGASRSVLPLVRMAALGATGALLLAFWLYSPRELPASGAVIESSDTPVAVQLRDGSSLELAAQTRLRVLRDQPSAVEVELAEGRASFDVKHVEKRAFSVKAGSVSVRVVGTKFDVVKVMRAEGTEIEVSVQRGVVEVSRGEGSDVRRLTVGEKWSVWIPAQPSAAEVAPKVAAPAPPPPAAQPAAPAPRHGSVHVRHSVTSSNTKAVAAHGGEEVAESATPAAPAEDVEALFSRATVARRVGLMEEAADGYAELLRRFPRDSRAGVAAFELGRIRMDALGDARGAAQAFSETLRLSKRGQYREDALARLVIANDAMGELDVCRKLRERYLSEYPTGVHVASLAKLCGDGAP